LSQVLTLRVSIQQVTTRWNPHDTFRRTPGTAADLNHFGGFNEMILHPPAAVETGGLGLLHHGLSLSVFDVALFVPLFFVPFADFA